MSNELKINMAHYKNALGWRNHMGRLAWNVAYVIFFRPFITKFLKRWRNFVLRCFGAKIAPTAHVNASAVIWAPWNLEMDADSLMGPHVDCYNVDVVKIGRSAVISQHAHLCAASHDISDPGFPLRTAPIVIEDQAWVAAGAFVGMGVTIGCGAVAAACSVVCRDVPPWSVVGGNPARFLKTRTVNKNASLCD